MAKHILILQGHPDPAGGHLCHALAQAYGQAAHKAGHTVRVVEIAKLDFPLLRTQKDWETGAVPDGIRAAQQEIRWAEHLVIVYPLWLGDVPAVLKAFLEQALRPGFAVALRETKLPAPKLAGRSARIVVTMGMPGAVNRWFFRAHSLKSLSRNILNFCGIAPVRSTLIGLVGAPSQKRVERWLGEMRALGARGI